jgi:hypothetical protein
LGRHNEGKKEPIKTDSQAERKYASHLWGGGNEKPNFSHINFHHYKNAFLKVKSLDAK